MILHIGAMKTATTYLQGMLQGHRELLGEHGWFVPAQGPLVTGVREILALNGAPLAPEWPTWDRVVRRARRHAARGTILSMEFLSFAHEAGARRIVDSLAGMDVHVVLTVRDAAAALPSQWQSLCRNRGVLSWSEFMGDLADDAARRDRRTPSPAARAFERTQHISRMLEVWRSVVGEERITVVTVPHPSQQAPPDEVWWRFLSVAGIGRGEATFGEADFENPRLGYESCDLLRRLNGAGLSTVPVSRYRPVMRHLGRRHLLALRSTESRPELDAAGAAFAASVNAETRSAVSGIQVVGSPEADLPADPPADLAQAVTEPSLEGVWRALAAAETGIADYAMEKGVELPPAVGADPSDLDARVQSLATVIRSAMTGESPGPSAGAGH